MAGQTHECQLCGTTLVFVRDVTRDEDDQEMRAIGGNRFTLPLASSIYECPNDHARFRIYISGAVQQLRT